MTWTPEPADWPRLRREPSETEAHVRDLLPAYVNGTLEPDETGRVVAHLRRCAGCRAALGGWEAVAGAARASVAPGAAVPDGLLRRVLAAVDDSDSFEDSASRPVSQRQTHPASLDRMAEDRPSAGATTAPRSAGSGRRPPQVAEWSAAAILVLLLAGTVAAFRLASETDRRSLPGAATDATPPVDTSVTVLSPDEAINVAECSTEPRPTGAVAALVGTRARTAPVLPDPVSEVDAPPGPEPPDPNRLFVELPRADGSALAEIQDTLRALIACRYYQLVAPGAGPEALRCGTSSRFFALYSDDFFRRYAVEPSALDAASPCGYDLVAAWTPSGPTPASLLNARVLPDGRILTLVLPDSAPYQLLIVFAKPDDRWLVDELNVVREVDRSIFAATPASRPWPRPQLVDAGLWDDIEVWSPIPASDPFTAAERVTVSVANLGTRPQRLEIQPLGYVVLVQPGRSVELSLHLPAGTYRLRSFAENREGRSVPALDVELVLLDDGAPNPPSRG